MVTHRAVPKKFLPEWVRRDQRVHGVRDPVQPVESASPFCSLAPIPRRSLRNGRLRFDVREHDSVLRTELGGGVNGGL